MKQLEMQIIAANDEYRKGTPIIDDQAYDELLEELRRIDPENDLLKKAVIEGCKEGERMEDLPYPMFSLEKVKTIKELFQWITSCGLLSEDRLIITPKYDGISLLIDEKSLGAWTRGDGIEGQRSDEHYQKLSKSYPTQGDRPFHYSFGEAVFSIKSFLANKGEYKSARNCVAGLFNSPQVSLMLRHAELVRYGTDMMDYDKDTQLSMLKKSYGNSTVWMVTTIASILSNEKSAEAWLNEVFNSLCSEYKCDGLVIEVNSAELRRRLGRLPNNNPRYAIAYKNPEWSERAETRVTGIEWNISKDGKSKPVILIEPIELCGATVQRASGYNAKYICDNSISEGSIVVIARSGDVIPKHLKTLSINRNSFQEMCDEMMICPSCGNPLYWDNTVTDLVCTNSLCEGRKVSELVYFFDTIGMEEFRYPTIKKIYQAGFKDVSSILRITQEQLSSIEGIGSSLSNTILSQFNELKSKGICFAKALTAHNLFGGVLGEKTCQKIFDNLSETDLQKVEDLTTVEIEHLTAIEGIGEKTAMAFNQGIHLYNKMEDEISISFIAQKKVEAAENQMSICFSGVRDKALEDQMIKEGHKIVSGITSKTTHLVVKDVNSNSSKTKKARELGITIYSLEDFKHLIEEY